MVAGRPVASGSTIEAERGEIQHVDEGIDRANRIVLVDVVVDRIRQQRRLGPIRSLDEPPHPILPLGSRGESYNASAAWRGFHTGSLRS